ncbi:MAG: tetratricopeptide repeat protein [Pseudobdellovibrio sp.]
MTQEDEILALQKELQENPRSIQFTKLAELYLSRDMNDAAFALVKQSLKFHPRSTSGLILLGRIYKLRKQNFEALDPLTEATKLAYDNWRAWLELAEAYVELKNGKQALVAFKKVLLFNPTHPAARRAVAKLELLTADEYEDDLFQMQKLPETHLETQPAADKTKTWKQADAALIRMMSYIDALIVRHDLEKATNLLNECSEKYGAHPEIETRRLKLSVFETPEFIEPKHVATSSLAKVALVKEKKIAALKLLLRRIEAKKSDILST